MATLAELNTLIQAQPIAFRAIAVGYEVLFGGVPNINGFIATINNAVSTNWGSNRTDITYNQENAIINQVNNLVRTTEGMAAYNALTAGAATLQDKLTLLYNKLVPAADQTAEGRAFFTRPEAITFYQNVAAERGVAGADGAAIVALSSLLNILINQDRGVGDDINDLASAIGDGSAALPETGNTFTPVETADGTKYDADDVSSGLTFTFTDASGEIVKGSAGADIYNAILGGPNATFNAFDQLQDAGGDGDVFNLVIRGGGAIPAGATVSGAEIINLDQTTADFNPQTLAGWTEASLFQGAKQIWQIEGFQNIAGLTAGQVAGFRDTVSGVGDALNHWAQYADGVAAGAIALDKVDSGSAVGFRGNNLTSATVSGSVDPAAGNAPGVLTVNLGSGVLFPAAAADTDPDTKIETLNLALTTNVNLSVIGDDSDDLKVVDASKSTGGITNNVATGGNNTIALTTVTGGSGNDIQTIDLASFKAATASFSGGAGNDVLTIKADGVASTTAVALTITGGAGNDKLDVDGLSNIVTATSNGITEGLVTLTDFNPDQDVLDFSGLNNRDVLTNDELANISGKGSLLLAVQAADAATNNTANDYSIFNFGSDMYVFVDTDGNGFDAGDGLIKVTGVSTSVLDAENLIA